MHRPLNYDNILSTYQCRQANFELFRGRACTSGGLLGSSFSTARRVGALLEITNYTYSGGSLVGTTNYFPQFDGNGNVAALVRSDGLTAAVYEYGPFGELLRNEAFDSAIADNPFRFSTKFLDLETGPIRKGHVVPFTSATPPSKQRQQRAPPSRKEVIAAVHAQGNFIPQTGAPLL